MKLPFLVSLFLIIALISVEGKRLSKGRSSSSSRGSSSSRKTSYNPTPTSGSNVQPSAPKPSLFGWQEKPVPAKQAPKSRQPNPSNSNTHSYPSSQTGLSGNQPKPSSTNQESVQRSNPSHSYPAQKTHASQPQNSNQQNPSYPASNGLSGGSSSGAGYSHQQGGLSGTGAGAPPAYSAGSNVHNHGPPPPYPGTGYPKQGTGLSGSGAAAPPPYTSGGSYPNNYGNNYGSNFQHSQGAPPPYNHYGGYGGHGNNPSYSPQMPGYYGNSNYGKGGFGGVSRSSNVLTGVGIAGAGIGTVLTGLALWNLARSTGRQHHTVIYDNRGQPVAVAPDNSTVPAVDPILGDLVNCTLTISGDNATEVLEIPCSIATSFRPEADVKDTGDIKNANDNTKCTITVVTKAGKEFMTTIPCSVLLNTAKENNVTEPPIVDNAPEMVNGKIISPEGSTNQTTAFEYSINSGIENSTLKCVPEIGDVRDPINPCFGVTTNLTVIPLLSNETFTTPSTA